MTVAASSSSPAVESSTQQFTLQERAAVVQVPSNTDLEEQSLPTVEPKRQQSDLHRRASMVRKSFTTPRAWVLAFGWSLAFCAGLVNIVAFRSWGMYTSHMTGDTTAIGMRIEGVYNKHDTDFLKLRDAIVVLFSFVVGAFLCGLLIDKNQVHFGGKASYGLALIGNSILLIIATFESHKVLAACFAACACGLQNAMCTSHFGAVVRTTHVTGTVTDIGSTLGRITMIFLRKGCRRSQLNPLEVAEVGVDARKLLVLLPMWFSFFVGTITGAYMFAFIGVEAMLIPATFTMVAGLVYTLLRQRLKQQFKNMEQQRLNGKVSTIRQQMQRALAYLQEVRKIREGGEEKDDDEESIVIELESGFEGMLETMRALEEEIGTFSSPSSSAPTRANSLVPVIRRFSLPQIAVRSITAPVQNV